MHTPVRPTSRDISYLMEKVKSLMMGSIEIKGVKKEYSVGYVHKRYRPHVLTKRQCSL